MATRELPLAESPIRAYMMYSYHLSVTFAHVEARPWFFTNFVQLQCDPSQLALNSLLKFTALPKGEIHLTEGTSRYNPWLSDCVQFDKARIQAGTRQLVQYVMDAIDAGSCVETFVDEYYLAELFNGGVRHFRHRLLVYGYDSDARRFSVVGFDKKKLYRKLHCTFDEFEQAFEVVEPQWFETTKLFKPREDARRPAVFDLARFVHVTRDYLASRNTLLDPDLHGSGADGNDLWYGARAYEFLGKYIAAIVEKGSELTDIRGFHTFWEHKKCMLDRIGWMRSAGYPVADELIARYRRVTSLCELARNRVVVHARGFAEAESKEEYLAKVQRYLGEAQVLEAEILERLLACVSS